MPLPLPPGDRPDLADVGDFRQGTAASQWALSRYLVGRAVGAHIARALFLLALAFVALAVGSHWFTPTWVTVLVALVAVSLLAVRALLAAVLRGLTGGAVFHPIEPQLRALVADTRHDVQRELRRIGLPSHVLTAPLLAGRLLGRRRARTVERLRGFRIDHVVPQSRLDELHLLVRSVQPPGTA